MKLFTATTPGSAALAFLNRLRRVVVAGVAGGAVATAVGLGVHEVATGGSWLVIDLEIEGANRASPVALRHLADVRQGGHLLTVDLDRAVSGVERHPWVKHATARRRFPGAVEITVEEYQPVMLLAMGDFWYVDGDGTVFRRARSDDLDYPVITGVDPGLATDPDLVRAIVAGAARVYAAATAHPRIGPDRVSELHFSASTGFDLVLRNGSRLVVGFADPTAGLDRLDRLVDAGLDLDSPQRIDLDAEGVAIATPIGAPT